MDNVATKSKDKLVNLAGKPVIQAGDNLDIRATIRHGAETSFHDVHLYMSMIYEPRIDDSQLSNLPPPRPSASTVNYMEFFLSADEMANLSGLLKYNIIESCKRSLEQVQLPNKYPQHRYEKRWL